MVRQCYLCKVYNYQEEGHDLSFHSFPVDPVQKGIWASLLGFETDHNIPKRAEICSKHFHPNDFECGLSGKRSLRKGAVPLARHSAFDSPGKLRLKFDDFSCIPGPSTSLLAAPRASPIFTAEQKLNSSSSTVTASEVEYQYEVDDTENRISPNIDLMEDIDLTTVSPLKERISLATGLETSTIESSCKSSSSTLTTSESEYHPGKRRYVGDLSSSDFSTPRKAKKNFCLMKQTIKTLRGKSHSLQTRNTYLRKRVKTMRGLINLLKEKAYLNNSSGTVLEASLSNSAQQILERMLKGASKQKYDPAIRCFALTLSFYSPKAYQFVRNTFNKSLPHPSTISKWYQSIDGSPGFTSEALNALKAKKSASEHEDILCNLVLDEMSIREQVEWTGTKFTGYIDIGTKFDSDVLPHAKEVLVFMLVCINGSWKLPVGYFFLDGLTGIEKAELVKKCLTFIHQAGVTVASVTFDGAPVNFTMASCLGADFKDVNNLKTHFTDPEIGDDVFIFLDPSHMIKLVRNTFGSQEYLTDNDNNIIDWTFLEKLVDKQNFEGLHLGTKIRNRHLQWTKEKMKVKIATQTLSKSVADALIYSESPSI
nr:unnamed protein product [Callosobruchus chinensis]